jgi:hypothetical protein
MDDMRWLVLNEHTLGYVVEDAPSTLHIVTARCWKGAPQRSGMVCITSGDVVRPATREDFEDYQVALPLQFAREKESLRGVVDIQAPFNDVSLRHYFKPRST